MSADFIRRLSAHRTRIVHEQGVARPPPNVVVEPPPDVRVGRPQPVATKKGLSGAMMRKTVGDVFAAGAKLGLPGPLLARHLATIGDLTAQVDKTSKAIAEGTRGQKPEQAAVKKGLPARVLGTMSSGLLKLDPASASRAISEILAALTSIAGSKISSQQARAIERIAFAASQLDSVELGDAFDDAVKSLGALDDEVQLKAASLTLVESVATIVASGGATKQLFVGVLQAALRALAGEEDVHAVANAVSAGLKAGLTDGQVEILGHQAAAARQHRDRLIAETEQAKAEADQLAGQLGDAVPELRARADARLSATSRRTFYQQLVANAGQPPELLSAIGTAQLSFLDRGAPPDGAADQISQLMLQLAGAGVPAATLAAIGERHLAKVEPVQAGATMTVLAQAVAADARLAALAPEAMAALADSLIGVTARYSEGDPRPLESLVAALVAGLEDPAVLDQATKNAARYSAEIPKVEGGPIVDHLRGSFAADLAAVAHAKLDVAILDSTWPRLPADAIARLVAIGVKQGANLDEWFTDLDKYFATGRGNKDHERNLRSLIVCADQGGSNAVALVKAILDARLRMADVCKLAHYMNVETNFEVPPAYVDDAIKKLKDANLLSEIEHRMHKAVMEQLNLGQLLQGAEDVRITEKGLADVQGKIAPLFSSAAGSANVNQDVLKGLLKAALADRVDAYRFETPQTEKHLACLTPEARALWMQPQTMMHIRFEGEGEQIFHQRIERAALVGKAVFEVLTEGYGQLEELTKQRDALVEQLHEADKQQDKEKRKALGRQMEGLPQKIEALEWASTLAGLTKDNITPERFERLGLRIPSLSKLFGPALEDAMEELVWTIRLTGISYSQVVTDDGPDLPTMYSMTVDRSKTGGGCLNWPGSHGEGMAYWTDPNKRMIITRNSAGQERRVVMRLVERQDEGHAGEPMLILEKSYPPFEANQEEKRRLIEHLLRRASSMGIACGFATEYYWDASKTSRFSSHAQLADMNDILLDLSKRYGTEVEKKEMAVLTRMGNTAEEYLDSDPPQGQRGVATVRRWTHNFQQESKTFTNEFIVLEPK